MELVWNFRASGGQGLGLPAILFISIGSAVILLVFLVCIYMTWRHSRARKLPTWKQGKPSLNLMKRNGGWRKIVDPSGTENLVNHRLTVALIDFGRELGRSSNSETVLLSPILSLSEPTHCPKLP